MKCSYRLVKIYHPHIDKWVWWIQYPVKIFGITIWWNTTTEVPYYNEQEAMYEIEKLCGDEKFYDMREIWHQENLK